MEIKHLKICGIHVTRVAVVVIYAAVRGIATLQPLSHTCLLLIETQGDRAFYTAGKEAETHCTWAVKIAILLIELARRHH